MACQEEIDMTMSQHATKMSQPSSDATTRPQQEGRSQQEQQTHFQASDPTKEPRETG